LPLRSLPLIFQLRIVATIEAGILRKMVEGFGRSIEAPRDVVPAMIGVATITPARCPLCCR
jgi:hypothetical protein